MRKRKSVVAIFVAISLACSAASAERYDPILSSIEEGQILRLVITENKDKIFNYQICDFQPPAKVSNCGLLSKRGFDADSLAAVLYFVHVYLHNEVGDLYDTRTNKEVYIDTYGVGGVLAGGATFYAMRTGSSFFSYLGIAAALGAIVQLIFEYGSFLKLRKQQTQLESIAWKLKVSKSLGDVPSGSWKIFIQGLNYAIERERTAKSNTH